ncbi:MAG: 50S ribosomal protein L21e [Nanoarchaeota archaeon]
MKRVGGFRRKTRSKLRKNVRDGGKISIRRFLQTFNDGDIVSLKAEPAIQTGMYFPRFHGLVGKVIGKQGKCYMVSLKDGHKTKHVIIHPVHLRRINNASN